MKTDIENTESAAGAGSSPSAGSARFAVDVGIVDPSARTTGWKEVAIYESRTLAEIVFHANRGKCEIRIREIPQNNKVSHRGGEKGRS